jgi:type IV secretory pathway VirJ component
MMVRMRWVVAGMMLLAAGAAGAGQIGGDLRDQALTDLPVIEHVKSGAVPDLCLLFFSGDGGWADLDRSVVGELVGAHYAVVGVDSLRWFMFGHSPGRSARDLFRLLMFYHRALPASRFVLAGYSRGAETLPFMVRRLPAEARAWIKLLALIAPGRETDFQALPIHGITGGGPPWSLRPVKPELDALRGMRMVGVYGLEEAADSVCTQAPDDFTTVVALPGGHHFGGNAKDHAPYVAVANAIKDAITAALAASP